MPTRRAFLAAALAPTPRPNILWLIGEDLCPDLGCYGRRDLQTPNLDRFAAEAIRYDRAFATGPICSPSRSALITGVHQTSIDAGNQRSHRDDGYSPPAPIRPFTHLLREAGYFTANVKGTGKTDWNFQVANAFDGDDWRRRKPGQPFFAQLSFREAHRPYAHEAGPPVEPSRIALPPYLPDHPAVRLDWAMYLASIQTLDANVGKALRRLEHDGLADDTVVIFFGDNGREMPRDKVFCYDGGIRVPLLIRFPPKHRPPGAAPGSVRDELVALYDLTATTLALAGVTPPAWMHGRPLFGPLARPRDYIVSATDRCGDVPDRVRCVRTARFKYLRNCQPERPYTQPSAYMDVANISQIVMRQLKAEGKLPPAAARVLAEKRDPEELYDIEADPFELHNLAGSPRHAQELRKLASTLDNWARDTGDKPSEKGLPAEYASNTIVNGWANTGGSKLSRAGGCLRMECLTGANFCRSGAVYPGGELRLEFRARSLAIARVTFEWGTIEQPKGQGRSAPVMLSPGEAWREYAVPDSRRRLARVARLRFRRSQGRDRRRMGAPGEPGRRSARVAILTARPPRLKKSLTCSAKVVVQ